MRIEITEEMLYTAIDSQPELVGDTYTERVMAVLLELIDEYEQGGNAE